MGTGVRTQPGRLCHPRCARSSPVARAAPPMPWRTPVLGVSVATSAALRGPLAEEALGAEDEDRDQDREDDRARPVAPRGPDRQPLVERLDEADEQRSEDGSGQVADAAEHRRGEGEEADLEAGVEAH